MYHADRDKGKCDLHGGRRQHFVEGKDQIQPEIELNALGKSRSIRFVEEIKQRFRRGGQMDGGPGLALVFHQHTKGRRLSPFNRSGGQTSRNAGRIADTQAGCRTETPCRPDAGLGWSRSPRKKQR
jgi:hypothetical protein